MRWSGFANPDGPHFAADTGKAAIVVTEFAPGGGVGVWLGKAASGDQEHEATLANLGWAVLTDLLAAKAVGIAAKWIRGRLVVEGADGRTVEFTKEAIEEARARLKNSGLAGTDEEVERYVQKLFQHYRSRAYTARLLSIKMETRSGPSFCGSGASLYPPRQKALREAEQRLKSLRGDLHKAKALRDSFSQQVFRARNDRLDSQRRPVVRHEPPILISWSNPKT